MITIRFLIKVILLLVQEIYMILQTVKSFEELEERIQQAIQKTALMVLREALEKIDEKLAAQRNKEKEKLIGTRSRTIVTIFGELEYRRRLYKDKETGGTRYLLDETLGIMPRQRLSSRISKLAIELGTEVSYRRAARIMGYMVPGVTPMSIWAEVQRAGKRAQVEAEENREAVFERGVIPAGKKRTKALQIEADGVAIKLQRHTKRVGEIKLIVGYEGKTKGARHLINRRVASALAGGETIWEEASAYFAGEWDLSQVEKIRVGGDGAVWIKEGAKSYFPQATYHLDLFHLRKRLTEALAFSSQCYEAVAAGIAALNWDAAASALFEAQRKAPGGAARKRIRQLKRYLEENWEGIALLPEEERLGAIEGEVRHIIARRMKRQGARWTISGGDHMARLLGAKADGRLERYASRMGDIHQEALKKAVGQDNVEWPFAKGEDPSSWLKVKVPALEGPFASTSWIKHVLRELVSIQRVF